ncbi:MAG: acyltransferase [Deltaproteobacteria bacterium]|nr:acyltransferase [Deltaproteobacteria bacterium]
MIRLARRITGIISGIFSFLYLIFFLNAVQTASLVLYPFSRRAFRAVNRWCARSIWGLWVVMAEIQNGIDVRFTGDAPRPRQNALVLPNHQSMADVLALMCLAWRCRRIGDMKWFVKDVVKWFPGFGWGMKFLDCLFVKRDWTRDRPGIERLFAKFRAEQIPMFLVSFLEGTRRTPKKHLAAQAFAKARGLRCPEHVLVPKTKGFVATMTGLRDHLDAVYDVTIGYAPVVPTLVACFSLHVRRIDVHVRVFPAASLPQDPGALDAWVRQRFEEKDALLEAFARDGRFPGPSFSGRVRAREWFASEHRLSASDVSSPSEALRVEPDLRR